MDIKKYFNSFMIRFSSAVIFLSIVVCFGYSVQHSWKGSSGNDWRHIITSDGQGYYAYLPCVFIYHGFDYERNFKEARKTKPDEGFKPTLVSQNKVVDKYFCGVAIMLLPFFLLAYLLSYLFGYGMGGYEFLFQISVSIAALFYLATGLIFIRKLLKEFEISEFIIGLTLILVAFGTNLFYYTTVEPSMSHVYSFGLTAIFLFYAKKSIDDFRFKHLIFMTVSLSVLVLIRPTNLLSILFIPFLAGSLKATSEFIKKLIKSPKILVLLLIASGIILIQLLLWHWQTGQFLLWSYQGEGFNFSKPHFFDELFSYKRGWFVYTPLMFVALLGGLITLYRQNIFRFFIVLLFFLLTTYILSSWSCWFYGAAFGLRAFIDYYPAFALLLGLFLNSIKSMWIKAPIIFITFLCVGLNMLQTSQILQWILPVGYIDKSTYWKVFLKTDWTYNGIFDHPNPDIYTYLKDHNYLNNFEHNTWEGDDNITTKYAHSGTHSVVLNEQNQLSPALVLKASTLPKDSDLYIYVKLWALMPDLKNNALMVVSVQNEKGECFYKDSRLIIGFEFEPNAWAQAYILRKLPPFKNPSDELKVYVSNSKSTVYIDDIEVSIGVQK